jgi:hypothetical protein
MAAGAEGMARLGLRGKTELRNVLIFDLRGAGMGTQGHRSHYSGGAFKSGKRIVLLWKKCDEPEWDMRRAGRLGEEYGGGAGWLLRGSL